MVVGDDIHPSVIVFNDDSFLIVFSGVDPTLDTTGGILGKRYDSAGAL